MALIVIDVMDVQSSNLVLMLVAQLAGEVIALADAMPQIGIEFRWITDIKALAAASGERNALIAIDPMITPFDETSGLRDWFPAGCAWHGNRIVVAICRALHAASTAGMFAKTTRITEVAIHFLQVPLRAKQFFAAILADYRGLFVGLNSRPVSWQKHVWPSPAIKWG